MAKSKKKSNKKHVPKSSDQILKEAKQKRKKNLKEKIQAIYASANLETDGCDVMLCKCACCSVAMPQMNYSEFVQIATDFWNNATNERKVEVICKSVEYFFRSDYEKWGMDHLIKPCQFLKKDGRCGIYENRPLSCRLYALWPEEEYEKRVDKFEEAYSVYGLTREDLPLAKQCKLVTLKNGGKEMSMEEIDKLFSEMNNLDKQVGEFTNAQMKAKQNYRTFHDWLLYKVYGEEWLSKLTAFMMAATREQMEEQVQYLKDAIEETLDLDSGNMVENF